MFPEHKKPQPTKAEMQKNMDKQAQEEAAFKKDLETVHPLNLTIQEIALMSEIIKNISQKYGDYKGFSAYQDKVTGLLSEVRKVDLTKQTVIALFNILTSLQLKQADFDVIDPIIKKLHPIAAVATNIPPKEAPVLTGARKLSN